MAFYTCARTTFFIFCLAAITINAVPVSKSGPGIEILPAAQSTDGQLNYVVVDNDNEDAYNDVQTPAVEAPQQQTQYVVQQRQQPVTSATQPQFVQQAAVQQSQFQFAQQPLGQQSQIQYQQPIVQQPQYQYYQQPQNVPQFSYVQQPSQPYFQPSYQQPGYNPYQQPAYYGGSSQSYSPYYTQGRPVAERGGFSNRYSDPISSLFGSSFSSPTSSFGSTLTRAASLLFG